MKKNINKVVSTVLCLLGRVPKDKLLHFIAGMLLTAVVACIRCVAPFSVIVGIISGAVKELWDSKNGGSVELMDFIATSAGAMTMQIVVWIYLFGY